MKLRIRIEGTDKVLRVSVVVAVAIRRPVLHLDELPDGSWRLTYQKGLFENIEQVKRLKLDGLEGNLKRLMGAGVQVIQGNMWWPLDKVAYFKAKDDALGQIHFDKSFDTAFWRMTCSQKTIPDLNKTPGLTFEFITDEVAETGLPNNKPLDESLLTIDLDEAPCFQVRASVFGKEGQALYGIWDRLTHELEDKFKGSIFDFFCSFEDGPAIFTGNKVLVQYDSAVNSEEMGDTQWRLVWRDFAIGWYKRVGRCVTANRLLMPEEREQFYQECMAELVPHLEKKYAK